jgi:hypothetical protein
MKTKINKVKLKVNFEKCYLFYIRNSQVFKVESLKTIIIWITKQT